MSTKRVIGTHVILASVLGLLLGIWALATNDDGRVHVVLVVPASIALLLVGYAAPVIAGVLVVAFLKRSYPSLSLAVYLGAYYASVALLVVRLLSTRDEPDSGLAVLAVPLLPIPAFAVTVAIAVASGAFRRPRV